MQKKKDQVNGNNQLGIFKILETIANSNESSYQLLNKLFATVETMAVNVATINRTIAVAASSGARMSKAPASSAFPTELLFKKLDTISKLLMIIGSNLGKKGKNLDIKDLMKIMKSFTAENVKRLTKTLFIVGRSIDFVNAKMYMFSETLRRVLKNLLMLTLVVSSPFFALTMVILKRFKSFIDSFFAAQKEKTKRKLAGAMKMASLGLMVALIPLILRELMKLGQVKWGQAFIFIGWFAAYIAVVTLIPALSQKFLKLPSVAGGSPYMQIALLIGAVAIGLVILGTIDWKSAFTLLGFIAGLIGMVVLYNFAISKWGKTKASAKKSRIGAFPLAVMVLAMALALKLLDDVNWSQASMLLAFIGAILISFTLVNIFGKKGGKQGGLHGFAMGIVILILAILLIPLVPWEIAYILILFISAVSWAIALPAILSGGVGGGGAPKGMLGFALGLVVLLLVTLAIAEMPITFWIAALKLVIFIAAITIAIAAPDLIQSFISGKTKAVPGVGKKQKKPMSMFWFAIGITIIVLALAATAEISFGTVILFVLAIFLIVCVMRFLEGGWSGVFKNAPAQGRGRPTKMKDTSKSVFVFVFAVVILTLCMLVISFLDTTNLFFNALIMVGVITVIVILFKWLNGDIGTSPNGQLKGKAATTHFERTLAIVGVILVILIVSTICLFVLSLIDDPLTTMFNALIMVGILVIVTGLVIILGKVFEKSPNIMGLIVAAAVVLIITIVATACVYALSLIEDDPLTLMFKALIMVGIIIIITGMILLIGVPPIFAFIMMGVVPMLIIAAIILIASASMFILGQTPIEGLKEKTKIMIDAIVDLGVMTAKMALLMIPMILGSIAMGFVVMIAKKGAEAMFLIGHSNIDETKIKLFFKTMTQLVDTINVGALKALKLGKTAYSLLPLFYVAKMYAQTLFLLGNTQISDDMLEKFPTMLSKFVDSFKDSILDTVKKMEDMKEGFKSMQSLIQAAKMYVDVIQSLANGTVDVYEVKNGKAVLKEKRKIDWANDIPQAQATITNLMRGLFNALKAVDINSDEYEDIDFDDIKESQEAVTPLISNISNIVKDIEHFQDSKKIANIIIGINNFFTCFKNIFRDIVLEQGNYAEWRISGITALINSFNGFQWDKINKGVNSLQEGMKKLVTNINGLELEKALALQTTIKQFNELDIKQERLEYIDKIILMIEKINERQEIEIEKYDQMQKTNESIDENTSSLKDKVSGMLKKSDSKDIPTKLDQISQQLDTLASNISALQNGKLKVSVTNQPLVVTSKDKGF
jgi:hypothetical protein